MKVPIRPPNPDPIKANQSPAFSSPAGLVEMRRTFTLDARTACPAEAPREKIRRRLPSGYFVRKGSLLRKSRVRVFGNGQKSGWWQLCAEPFILRDNRCLAGTYDLESRP
ncbi:hypothetical protein LEMLEM_LOCUS8819 [Lemmus lemmus]